MTTSKQDDANSQPGEVRSSDQLGPLVDDIRAAMKRFANAHMLLGDANDRQPADDYLSRAINAYRRAAVAAERERIAAEIREAWHQREASHGNRAGEYHDGMLAGLDAAVAVALRPNV